MNSQNWAEWIRQFRLWVRPLKYPFSTSIGTPPLYIQFTTCMTTNKRQSFTLSCPMSCAIKESDVTSITEPPLPIRIEVAYTAFRPFTFWTKNQRLALIAIMAPIQNVICGWRDRRTNEKGLYYRSLSHLPLRQSIFFFLTELVRQGRI